MHIPNSSNIIPSDFHINCVHATFLWHCRYCPIVRDQQQKPPRSSGQRSDDRMFSLGSGMCWTRVLWFIRSLKKLNPGKLHILPYLFLKNCLKLPFTPEAPNDFLALPQEFCGMKRMCPCPKSPVPNPLPMWSTDTGTCSLDSTIWILNTVTVSVGEFVVCLTAAKTSACLFLGAEGRVCLCSNPSWASWP